MNPFFIILSNLMTIRLNDELNTYERATYEQLLVTTKAQARLEELRARAAIKEAQDGQRTDQTTGGVPSPTPETPEHRGDDSTPAV
jgi:hypothetical protein